MSRRKVWVSALAIVAFALLWLPSKRPSPDAPVAATEAPSAPVAHAPPAQRRAGQRSPAPPPAHVGDDAFTRALARHRSSFQVSGSVSALFHTPAGRAILPCLGIEPGGPFEPPESLGGFDLGRDADRIAFVEGGALFSGPFSSLLGELAGRRCGPETTCLGEDLALWRDELLIIGRSPEFLKETTAALETPGSAEAPGSDLALSARGALVSALARQLFEDGRGWVSTATAGAIAIELAEEMALTATLELGSDDAGRDAEATLRRLLAERAVESTAPGAIDRGMRTVLEEAIVERSGPRVTVALRYPAELLERRLAGCRIGAAELPEGYQPVPADAAKIFGLGPPPGFVELHANAAQLSKDWPGFEEVLGLEASLGSSGPKWVDPRTLGTLALQERRAPGSCARLESFVALVRQRPEEYEVATVQLGPRRWHRITSDLGRTRSITYEHCAGDHRRSLYFSLPLWAPLPVLHARLERYLLTAPLD